jgi:cytosine/adenosine deaminase-related metal-dependent hydrolase
MNHASDEDLDIIAASEAKVAHCPRSNQLLQAGRMPLEKMLARNIPVAIGTDSLASSPSLDVRQEAQTAVTLHQNHVEQKSILSHLHNSSVLT